MASIIDAIVQKPMRESQLKSEQQDRFNSQLNNVQQIADQASKTVQSFVEASKQRQKQDAMNTLASILSRSGEMVPGETVKASSSFFPGMTQAQGSIPFNKTPEFLSQIASQLPKAAPEQFGREISERAAKALFPDEQGGRPLGRGAFQQSAMQVNDPKTGRLKTVAVMFDGQSGKYFNPLTREEITSEAELQNLPEKGFAQTESPDGFTSDGRQIVRNRSGSLSTVESDGTHKPYSGVVYKQIENAPSAFMESLSDLSYSQNVLKRMAETFNPEFVGPIAAKAGNMTKYLDALTDDQRVQFYGDYAEYKNSIIKAITGAQMSEVEAKRIIQQIPDINASPEAFVSGLKRAYASAESRIKSKQEALKRNGFALRSEFESPISSESLNEMFDQKLSKARKQTSTNPENININSKKIQSLFDELAKARKAGK